MPITINDCKYCGQLPDWGYDYMGDGFADLILFCQCPKRKKYHEVKDASLKEVVEEWNDRNEP